jgi:hypothetical protein
MTKRRLPKRSAQARGRILRPKPVVLKDAALVPDARLIKPPPNHFTHELARPQPYYYGDAHGAPDGEFAAGTRVVLMVHEGGAYCRVVDPQGLYVLTACDGLRALGLTTKPK